MDILNSHRFTQSLTANGQVQMAPVQFDQCAAFTSVCKNRTESIHQQTLRKSSHWEPENIQLSLFTEVKEGSKIEKYIFKTVEISKINKICYN